MQTQLALTPKFGVIFSPEPDDAIEHTGYDVLAVFIQTDSLLFVTRIQSKVILFL